MKRNVTITFLLLVAVLCNFAFGQKNRGLAFGELKPFYHNNDTVSLIVQNISDRKYYMVIALEKENRNGWVEVLDDIDRESIANTKNVVIINPRQKRIIEWVPSDLFCEYCHERKLRLKGKYRLRVKYSSEVTDIRSMEALTSSFILK